MNTGKLLRGLVRHGMRGGRRGGLGGLKGSIGLGALGVAIAAFEHFVSSPSAGASSSTAAGGAMPPPTGSGPGPPPPPPRTSETSGGPPPPPASTGARTQEGAAGAGEADDVNLLLIRTMSAAAHADGEVGEDERRAILSTIEEAGCGVEEREFLERSLEEAVSVDELVNAVPSADVAPQVYMAALLAIDVDSEAERAFLERLRDGLALDQAVVDDLHEQFLKEGS